jgi:DNA primase
VYVVLLSFNDLLGKIYEDNKVELILESLECHNIHYEQNNTLLVAALPNGDNKRSVQVRLNECLTTKIRSKGVYGSIYDLVMYIKKCTFYNAYLYLLNVCRYDENTKYVENPLAWLNKIKRQRQYYDIDEIELPILNETILNQFIYKPINKFLKDGISQQTLDFYKVGFDVMTQRITIPIRDLEGNLIGVKGRYIYDYKNTEKYLYIKPYCADQSKTFFNYHNALPYIKGKNEVIIGEAEKFPMQMRTMGIYNVISIGSSGISRFQLQTLLNLQCDIVLAYDKGIDWEIILKDYSIFEGRRNLYAIMDDFDLLPDKHSPSDDGIDFWNTLYNSKTQIY